MTAVTSENVPGTSYPVIRELLHSWTLSASANLATERRIQCFAPWHVLRYPTVPKEIWTCPKTLEWFRFSAC